MSSFTSGASLRRRCLVPSVDQQRVVCAHGPFLESYNVSDWEQHKIDFTKQPNRVKLFHDLGAYIETVLPLGSSGHYVAFSNVLNDKVNKEFRVYASLVHSDHLMGGGFADPSSRFVVSSQPWSERPCAPKVSVQANTNRVLVLTTSSLKAYEFSKECDTADLYELFNLQFDKSPKSMKGLNPLFIASSYAHQFMMLNESRHVVVVTMTEDNNMDKTMLSEYKEMDDVTAAYHIPDRNIILVANEKEMHVITTTDKGPLQHPQPFHFSYIAYVVEEAILQFEVTEGSRSGENIVFALSKTMISIYRLTDKLTIQGKMEFDDCFFTACTHIHRSPECSVEGKKYLLLAVACENGDVKFVDAASYMNPTMSVLPSSKDDPNEIVSFFPVWEFTEEADDEVDCLEGIYAVTSSGQLIYRTPTDNDITPCVTKVIADGVVDMSSFTTRSGKVSLVAYGSQSIYIHRISLNPRIHIKDETSHLTTDSLISECFASSSHFLVVTADTLALVNMSATEAEARGITMDTIELDGMHSISTYGAIYGKDGEADLQLSVVGTSNGHVYTMKLKPGELHADESVEDIQDLLDCYPSNELTLHGPLSASFLESGNERVVSACSRWVEGRMEMFVLGAKGTLVRFTYSRERGTMILEVHMASAEWSNLSFRSLTTIRGLNEPPTAPPLIVAYETTNSTGIQSVAIRLLEWKSRDTVLAVGGNQGHCANLHSSGHVHVYRSEGGEWGRVTLYSLHTTQNSKKKKIKDSFVAYEGVLKRTSKDELVINPPLPPTMQSLHIFSKIDGRGVRTAGVFGVSYDEIAVARLTSNSKLVHQIDMNLMDTPVEPCCSGMIHAEAGPLMLVGCSGGEVLLVWDTTSHSRELMLTEPTKIIQITPFTSSRSDLNRKDKFMFAMLTETGLSVCVQGLEELGDKCTQLRDWKFILKGDHNDFTLYAMGTADRHHNVWLCSKKNLRVWRGHKGVFDRTAETRSLDVMEGVVTASVAIPVIGSDEESIRREHQIVEIVCVGTTKGKIGWFYSVNTDDGVDKSMNMKYLMLHGVGTEIKALDGMVVQPAYVCEPNTIRFGVCIYVLTAHRVTVNFVNVELKKGGITANQVAQHHLYHLVRDPFLLSAEKTMRPHDRQMCNHLKETTRRRDIPQRVIVSGENEMEVLLMCPKKLFKLENDLEVVPQVRIVSRDQLTTVHSLWNNTDGTMHVSIPSGDTVVINPYSHADFAYQRVGVLKSVQFGLRYRVEKEGEKNKVGNVTVFLTEK